MARPSGGLGIDPRYWSSVIEFMRSGPIVPVVKNFVFVFRFCFVGRHAGHCG